MDPNAIPDISPTITHHDVLTVAEENSQLEALTPPQEMQMQQCTIKLSMVCNAFYSHQEESIQENMRQLLAAGVSWTFK
jgi:hypothetical protein